MNTTIRCPLLEAFPPCEPCAVAVDVEGARFALAIWRYHVHGNGSASGIPSAPEQLAALRAVPIHTPAALVDLMEALQEIGVSLWDVGRFLAFLNALDLVLQMLAILEAAESTAETLDLSDLMPLYDPPTVATLPPSYGAAVRVVRSWKGDL